MKLMRGKLGWFNPGVVILAALLGAGSTPAVAQSIAEKAEDCAACHGQNGKPIDKSIPIIWGQQLGYTYIQLRDFKRGDRKNETIKPTVSALRRTTCLRLRNISRKS